MSKASFVHLHLHSQYSLLDGAIRIPELLEAVASDGQNAVAITDHGNLFAVVPFMDQAARAGIKPIIGCEVYVAKGSRKSRGSQTGKSKGYNHLILLASNEQGYRSLTRLVSLGFLEGFYYKPRVDREVLAEHSNGLIALSGCLNGVVAEPLLAGRPDLAEKAIRSYQGIYGPENFFVELQNHDMEEDRRVLPAMIELARTTGAPMVATNDSHYLRREDAFAHEVLLGIQTGKTMDDPTRWRFPSDQFYLKSSAEMESLFADVPEAIENTQRIADRIDFRLPAGENFLPSFSVPSGLTLEDYFRQVVKQGLEERLPRLEELGRQGSLRHPLEDYRERLERELDMIIEMKFPGYFLIVWDFIRYARQAGIPVGPGRGSAAGSLVSYCLRITDIDPLQYDLLFERFLNPERVTMPDIDIDFCMRGRSEVISYVTEKYGRDNVAQIITFGTMAARGVVRDVGRSLGFTYGEVDRIAKLVPADLDATIEKALGSVPQLGELVDKEPRVRQLMDIARKLEGLTRHASTHAAGVVITPKPVIEFCPLYKTNKDEIVTQFAKDDVERIGLLKMDFLGLRTLTVIADTVDSIRDREGVEIEVDKLPIDDEATLELFREARTTGVFQVESSGMREILRKLAPDRFEDLIALNALYRPGTIKGGMIDEFIRRRHGETDWDVVEPALKDILDETYGVIVYQEQVMRIASKLAGFSLGEADLLRRAMGKKKKDVMAQQRQKFLAGCKTHEIREANARKIFELMEHFAEYGFNKSHSAAYAWVAYQTGYLKAHYPVHYMAALLTSEKDNTKNVVKYINACREMGIEVLPPDINASELNFTVAGKGALRFGLAAIKNVGEGAIRSVLEVRGRKKRFRGLRDFLEDLDLRLVNKRVVESLIKAGALDCMGTDRARLAAGLERAYDAAQRAQQDKLAGQESLFGAELSLVDGHDELPEVPSWTEAERLGYERETLGYYVSGHPLAEHGELLKTLATTDSATLAELNERTPKEVHVGGLVASVRSVKTRRGSYMAHVQLEDQAGTVEVLVFPDLFTSSHSLLEVGSIVVVSGKAEPDEDSIRLLASEIVPLSEAKLRGVRAVSVTLQAELLDRKQLEELRRIAQKYPGGAPLGFEIVRKDAYRARLTSRVVSHLDPTPTAVAALEAVSGPGSVRILRRS